MPARASESVGQMHSPSALSGVLFGVVPLVLLVSVVVMALAGAAFVRQLVTASGFFVQQEAALIVLIAGFVLALVVFALAISQVLKRVARWQQDGAVRVAGFALWALGITALVVVLPVLLAVLLPQHPAS
ncbi:MAG: hypothetical protein JO183_00565 [Ktedonobacteraceae bacterium]|nr:hypothetical protein [Ktedonobacteraceae bacterium]MBV9021440.1 hypothetical protein [Ktedonobacteraceae bacterium]